MTSAKTTGRKTTRMKFEIIMEPDEDGFHVWCPALRGCHSFGLTRDEARQNIKDAIEGWLESADPTEHPILERARIEIAYVQP